MLIAICDDEQVFRDSLRSMIFDYKKQHRLNIDVYEFNNGQSLLDSGKIFDMVFLDYQMPGIDGMNVARELRKRNCTCCIVFATAFTHFVYDSFEVQPYRFLVKPLRFCQIESLMNSFIMRQKQLAPLIVINDFEQIRVQAKNILYLEGDGKYCTIRTLENTYKSSQTMAQVHSLLPKYCFYRSHKSYVVNLYSVESFEDGIITLSNGEIARIGRSKIAEFKRVYKQFIKDYYIRL